MLGNETRVAIGAAIYRSPEALWARNAQKVSKVFPGLPAWSVKQVSQMTRKRVKKTTKSEFGDFFRSLGNGVRKNGVRNRCPYRRCDDVGSILKFRIGFPFGENSACFVPVRVAPGVDTEFPYRVRIVDRGVDGRDPVCRHRFRS